VEEDDQLILRLHSGVLSLGEGAIRTSVAFGVGGEEWLDAPELWGGSPSYYPTFGSVYEYKFPVPRAGICERCMRCPY
jgi:hypothetical protein